jgi:hypothetical protein
MRSYLNNVVSFLASPGLTDTTSAAKEARPVANREQGSRSAPSWKMTHQTVGSKVQMPK